MLLVVFLSVVVVAQVSASSHEAQPYEFGYSIKDKHGQQHREETSSGPGSVKGSYGFTDDRGIHRVVEYVADHNGFRAHVKTNEPGTAKENPAAVKMASSNNQIPAGPHAFSFAAAGQKAPVGNVIKHTNNAGYNNGFGLLNLNKEYGFPGELNIDLGEEMFNQGYGLDDGLDIMGYGDLMGGNVGYNSGNSDNLIGYYGNNGQGFKSVNANNFKYRGHFNKGYSQSSSNLGGSLGYISGDGKYKTNLVGGSVKGYDNRYSNLKKGY